MMKAATAVLVAGRTSAMQGAMAMSEPNGWSDRGVIEMKGHVR
jgi:hypothetical protein